ncbi:MAG TPA: hypothetical protein VFO77_12825, partial [Actinoplanes sp.]|nr:hypothetical protein [Actinoplanes sp.]
TVLSVAVGITVVVLAYLYFVPATFQSTAVVVLRPVVTDPFTYPAGGADRAINMTAESGIAASNDVIDATARIVGISAEDTRDGLTIEVPTGGQVLRFEFDGATEEQAVIGANAAAETYLNVRKEIYQQQRAALLLSYDNTIRLVTEQRKKAQKDLPDSVNSSTSSPSVQAVLDQVRALNDQLAQLANQRAKIDSADLSPGAVTAAARAPATSSHDAAPLFLLGGVLGGILLGMIAAHIREVFDRRIRSVEQAADVTGLPALGQVRAARRRKARAALADARYIALAVGQWIDQPKPPPLVVISGRANEGRTQVAGGLAVAIAEAGHEVFLGAGEEHHDKLRTMLFAAQRRAPAVPRPGTAEAKPRPAVVPPDLDATVVIHVPGRGSANGSGQTVRPGTPSQTGKGANRPAGTAPGAVRVVDRGVKPVPAPPQAFPDIPAAGRRPVAVQIGAGTVLLGPPESAPPGGIAVIDAPPADTDERGVRAAQSGVAVLVIGRDTTRDRDLSRLLDRLRSAGARTVGFVLTGGKGA